MDPKKNKLISIVIPAYNEESAIEELRKCLIDVFDSCDKYEFEVIIVENGSYDSTFELLVAIHCEDPRFKIIQLSRNFGIDGGVSAGLSYVSGDAVIIMNADLQDPPDLIPDFIKKWEEGYDIVYGIIEKREGVSLKQRIISRIAYKVIFFLCNKTIPENATDFRLIDRKICNILTSLKERNRYVRGLITWTGFKQIGIPFVRKPRCSGESKIQFKNAWRIAMNGIFSFSYYPLKLASYLGISLSISSLIFFIYQLYLFSIYGRVVPGYTATILVILFCFGMVFLIIGILGCYIERIYDEVKERPNYIIRDEIGFNQLSKK